MAGISSRDVVIFGGEQPSDGLNRVCQFGGYLPVLPRSSILRWYFVVVGLSRAFATWSLFLCRFNNVWPLRPCGLDIR